MVAIILIIAAIAIPNQMSARMAANDASAALERTTVTAKSATLPLSDRGYTSLAGWVERRLALRRLPRLLDR